MEIVGGAGSEKQSFWRVLAAALQPALKLIHGLLPEVPDAHGTPCPCPCPWGV